MKRETRKVKRIIILGSTGSIGRNALRVVSALNKDLVVSGLSARSNWRLLLKQAEEFSVSNVAIADPLAAEECSKSAPLGLNVFSGPEGLDEMASKLEADTLLCAVVGLSGLSPVLGAVQSGKDVALATKEVLVSAGGLLTQACSKHRVGLLPVDSEQSALHQCLDGARAAEVSRIILTASGGPFENRPEADFDSVTVEDALSHPNWSMGEKVSIDSATMMNKGLEMIEAAWLFDVPFSAVEVLVHPESIVHSLVEFRDRSILAQMSVPDMRFAIQYALTYPDRLSADLPSLDLARCGSLNFRKPDENRFPCLRLARTAGLAGGTMPAVMNAANEVAVSKFVAGAIPFSGIPRVVEETMRKHEIIDEPGLNAILQCDTRAREQAEMLCAKTAE
ncbi:MAG: 1-deoxy-D-xylulose-5-phosphate reductoisomerase [Kiritimatiellia bacterium]